MFVTYAFKIMDVYNIQSKITNLYYINKKKLLCLVFNRRR